MTSADSSVLMPAPRPLQPPGVPGMPRGYQHPLHVSSVAATGTSSGSLAGGRVCAPPVGFGSPRLRSSYHDRLHPRRRDRIALHQQQQQHQQRYHLPPSRVVDVIANRHAVPPTAGVLYRSSSSLELEHHHLQHDPARVGAMSEAALRREFGSHGSIDVMSRSGVFAQLKDFRSLDPEAMEGGGGRRSAGADSDPGRAVPAVSSSAVDAAGSESSSPRLRGAGGGASRLQRLWDRDRRASRKNNSASAAVPSSTSTGCGGASASEPSLFRRLRGSSRDVRGAEESAGSSDSLLDADARQEERRRRRALVHYDWQSLLVNLGAAARRRGQLTQRRNTTTGASAASMPTAAAEDLQPTLPPAEEDQGDGRSNELVHSCPFFRNELGGEQERCISLSVVEPSSCAAAGRQLHRPASTCGLSVLEQPPNLTHWPVHHCPFSRPPAPVLETSSLGAFYYKDFFHGKPHENWVGVEEGLGPVAVSIRRDQLVSAEEDGPASSQTCYRVIVRTSELATIRGLILEDSLCQLGKSSDKQKRLPVREVLDHVAPEIHPSCLRLAIPEKRTEDYLMKLDEQNVFTRYKVGVMYCRAGQGSEEEMYNNEVAGPAFNEFLEMIGQRVRLKGFDKYKAGLDNKTDTTGQYSVYAQYQGNEIMFHVSTMLQYSPNNRQQLLRKRYIGNDIVTIVFQEPGALPFSPKSIRSQFQHVFIVVRALNPCAGANTQYRVAVNRFRDVPPFGPPLSETAVYVKGKALAEFLYAKVINAETSSYQSEKFVTMARRTRQEYLKDLAANYVTDTTLDQHQKFSLMSFSSRKKERPRPRFNPDLSQRGAVAWPVTVDDHSRNRQFDCVLGISADAVVLADESSSELVFAAPASSILGWTLQGTSLRVYYHLGECVVLHARTSLDTEELAEIAARLAVVSKGTETQELLLRRNVMGQLGLHVQQDGLVTEVEQYSPAWQLGLRPGARLVEICKIAVCSMSYDQMVDLLKTSPLVSVTLVAPLDGGSSTALRGCTMPACGRAGGFERGDYENVQMAGEAGGAVGTGTVACRQEPSSSRSHQLPGVRRQRRRSTSPSLSSSGYNTAGTSGDGSLSPAEATGTMSSTSSAGSCGSATGGGGAGRHGLLLAQESPPPPPLPVRHSRQQQPSAVRVGGGALVVDYPTAPVAPPSGQMSNYMSPSSIHRNIRQQQALRDSAYNYSELSSLVTRSAPPEQCNLNSLSTYLIDADSSSTSAVPPSSSGPAAPPSLDSTGSSTASSLKDQSRLLSDRWPPSVEHTSSRSQQKAPDVRLHNGDAISSTSASTAASAAVAVRRSSTTRTGGSHAAHRVSSSLQQDLLRLIAPGEDDDAVGSRPQQEVIVTTARPATVVTPGGGGDPRSAGLLQMDWQSLVDMADRASSAQHSQQQQQQQLLSSISTAAGDLNEHSRSSAGSACSAGRSSSLHSSPTSSLANGYAQQPQRSTPASTTSHDQPPNGSLDNLLVGGGTASSSPENLERIGRQDSPSSGTIRSSPAMPGGSAEAPVERSAVMDSRLVSIEQQLVREQCKRQTLENQVRQLSKDNRRLQEESKQAAQQLRKFTEWFFANFEKP